MAFLRSVFTNLYSLPNFLGSKILGNNPIPKVNHVSVNLIPNLIVERSKYIGYTDWRMLRDAKRRKVVKEYAKLRLQLNALRYNTVLPKKLQDVAQKDIEALPTDSCHTKLHARCVLTSRARGRWRKFRMSRIIWRHLADYNQLSGAERAMW